MQDPSTTRSETATTPSRSERGAIRDLSSSDEQGANVMPAVDIRSACRLAREIASAFLNVPVHDIDRPTRAIAPICEARHVSMYLAHVVFQVPLTAMAGEFGRDRTTVAHAVRRIEDRRDDANFDAVIERLERLSAAIRAALGGGGPQDGGGKA
ncbi:helix-turn-helix domain-containing protein [Aurantimonas sp. A2-1-M11]|uniref:helix-turn-helix domain-containing protein n=1 Tax=Aurantimonas sp. A2-1-M11 TaxID=3113712 RepID=UPI002F94682D